MRILLTGGGTGGHVIPNIALLEAFDNWNIDVAYMGGANSIEERLAKKNNIPFYPVTTVKLDRAHFFKNLLIPMKLIRGIHEAKKIIRSEHFDGVFSKGGYVSLPAAIGASLLRIPVITHESDRTLGVANKIIARSAKAIITPSKDIRSKTKVVNLMNPIRPSIFRGNKDNILSEMQYDSSLKFLLVLGGSSGAMSLNNFVYDNIDALTEHYNVLHIAGKTAKNITHKNYHYVSFTDHIEDYFDLADLVITRSGAGTIAELFALKKKCLLVPLENKSSRGDQLENAKQAVADGSALMIRDNELSLDKVTKKLEELSTLYLVYSDYDRATPEHIVSTIIDTINAYKK